VHQRKQKKMNGDWFDALKIEQATSTCLEAFFDCLSGRDNFDPAAILQSSVACMNHI
jgi:hypothetical protein